MAAKKFRTALIIDGDSKGAIRATKATDQQLAKLDKQQKLNSRSAASMTRNWAKARTAARGLALSVVTAGAALSLVTSKALSSQDQVGKLAQQLGVSTEALSELQFAAEQTGAGADKLSAGLEVMSKRLGEVAYKGSGAAKAALDKLGLSAEELVKLRPDEAFARIADAMQNLSSQSERNAAAANIFSRANQQLVNTLALGSDGMAEMRQEARDLGRSISGEQAAAAAEAEDATNRLKSVMQGTSNVMATAFAPAVTALANGFTDELSASVNDNRQDIVNWGDVVGDVLALTADSGTGALSSLKYGFSSFGSALGATAAEAVAAAHFNFSQVAAIQKEYEADQRKLDQQYINTDLHKFRDELAKVRAKNASLNVNDSQQGYKPPKPESKSSLLDEYDKITAKLKKLKADRAALVNAKATADPSNLHRYETAIDAIDKKIAGLHKTTKKTLSDSARAADSLDKKYASIGDTLSQQVALFGQTDQAAQTRYDIEHGALQGISEARKTNLLQMSAEIDRLNAQKTAVQALFPEFQKLQQASALRKSVADLPPELQTFGKRRAAQLAGESATEGLPGGQGLDPQFNGPFGEADRLEDDRAKYEEKYQQRLEAFQQFARTHQDQKAEADAAIEALESDHQQRMQQYDDQTAKARRVGYEDLYGSLTDIVGQFAGRQSGIYNTLFAAEKAYHFASVLMSSTDAISKAWASAPFPYNLGAVATTVAETGVLSAAVSSVSLSGQAHDGLDNVPREGTWLLDRGERVVDRRTNVDLKQYLQRENAGSTGAGATVSINMPITVEGKPGQSDEDARRQGQQIGEQVEPVILRVIDNQFRPGGRFENVKRTG